MFTALLDANVLVPISLTDTLLRAAENELFQPRWSTDILRETEAAIQRIRPDVAPASMRSRLEAMDGRFPDASVIQYDSLIPGIALPDPKDRHVVAAAIAGHADIIVTRNLKDFPPAYPI